MREIIKGSGSWLVAGGQYNLPISNWRLTIQKPFRFLPLAPGT